MNKPAPSIIMAKIGAPHGIKGELRVTSYTQNPLDFSTYGPLHDRSGNEFTVTASRQQKNLVIAKFAQIGDRNIAEKFTNTEIFVARDKLPDPEEDEFYIEDLIGMQVNNYIGKKIGHVKSVQDFGAGNMLEISSQATDKNPSQKTWFIEFSSETVPEIDMKTRMMAVKPKNEISERDKDNS